MFLKLRVEKWAWATPGALSSSACRMSIVFTSICVSWGLCLLGSSQAFMINLQHFALLAEAFIISR